MVYKLVIIDDEIIVRESIKNLIKWESLGVQVVGLAEDGEKAFEIICETNPDIVLCDIRMPGMDGIELINALRNSSINCHVIVISGYSNFDYAQKAMRLGAFDYILKPIDEKELISRIKECINVINKQKQEDEERKTLKSKLLNTNQFIDKHLLLDFITNKSLHTNGEYKFIYNITKDNERGFIYAISVVNVEDLFNECLNNSLAVFDKILDTTTRTIGSNHCTILKNPLKEIIIIFVSSTSDKEKFKYILINILNTLVNEIEQIFSFKPSIGLSSIHNSYCLLPDCYNEAVTSYCFRIFNDNLRVLDIESVVNKVKDKKIDPDIHKKICNYVKLQDKSNIDKALKDMIAAYIKLCNGKEFNRLISITVNVLEYCFKTTSKSLIYTSNDSSKNGDYIKKLYLCRNIEDIFYLSRNALFDLVDSISNIEDSNHRKIVLLAQNYIKDHYNEKLTLNQIAENFFLTPSHFSKIFSAETGEPFSKYLVRLRINKAKELLKNPCIKVYEVANKIGYEDIRYFMRIFKEHTGVTALQYREKII